MAVGDVFKKRRNLVQQQSAAPAMRKAMNYYPGHPDYVPPKMTYQMQWRIANGQNPYNANFIYGVDDRDENGNPMKDNGMQLLSNKGPQSFNPQNQDVLARASAALDAIEQDRLNPMYGGQQGYAAPGANGSRIGGTSPIPNLITGGLNALSNGLNFAQDNVEQYYRDRPSVPPVPGSQKFGYAAPGQNAGVAGSPGLRGFVDSVGRGVGNLFRPNGPNPMYGGQQLYAAPGANGVTAFNGPGTPAISNPINRELAPAYDPRTASIDSARARIDARVQQSQRDNPMSPQTRSPYDRLAQSDRMLQRNMDFIQTNPRPRTSLDAGRMGQQAFDQGTSGLANGYNGILNPLRVQPEEKFDLADRNARRVVGGGAAADPTNMRGRFGGEYGAGLNADATAIAEGRAVRTADGKVVYHTGTQESARAAQIAGKSDREWLRNRNNMNVPQAELDRRAAADAQKAARAAKHQAFKDANGGMSYRQYDRMTGSSSGNNALTMKAVKEGRLSPEEANYRMQLRAEKALRRSGNPITGGTSQAGQLYPDMTAGKGGQNKAGPNPLAAAATNKFMPNGIVTPDSSQAARDTLKVMAEGGTTPDGSKVPPSPMFAGLAASPDNIQGVHFGIQQMVQEGKDLGVEDLRNLHAAAVAMQAGYGTSSYDPFDMTYGAEAEGLFGSVDTEHTKVFGPMYKQLVGMKAPTDEALRGWWQSFKGNIRPDTNRFIGGSSILSGEGAPTVSPGGYEYPVRPKKEEPFLRNPMKP